METDNLIEEIEKRLCEILDTKVYLPVKEELKDVKQTYSLGKRKEDFKQEIHNSLSLLKGKFEVNDYVKALAQVKILLNRYYEKLGREVIEDTLFEMKKLIEDIDDSLIGVEIPARFFVADRLNKENKRKKLR